LRLKEKKIGDREVVKCENESKDKSKVKKGDLRGK
jgi:hypothetical protein